MKPETNRIEVAGQGLGEISEELIRQRAAELARIDGRPNAHRGDLEAARIELIGHQTEAPEVNQETGELVAWDEAPSSSGHQVPRVPLEDEGNLVEELFQEGLEEGEHARRVEASDQTRSQP